MRIVEDNDFKGYYRIVGSRRYTNTLLTYDEAVKIVLRYTSRYNKKEEKIKNTLENITFSYDDLYGRVVTPSDIEETDSDAFEESEANDDMSLGAAFIALYGHDNKWKDTTYSRTLYDISKNKELLRSIYIQKSNTLDEDVKRLIHSIVYPFEKFEDKK